MQAEALTRALGGRWYGSYGTACCPAHNDVRPSLSIRDGNSGLLLFCHAGCAYADVARAIEGKHSANTRIRVTAYRTSKSYDPDKHRSVVRSIWEKSLPIQGTGAEGYLRERSILGPLPEALGFHPGLRHPTGNLMPAMVGRIDRGNETCTGIHRTFLERGAPKKTSISPTRAMLGRCAGGAVRLRRGKLGLVVCEGIETGLSLCDRTERDFAVWSALSTAGVSGLQLPQPKNHSALLIVAADGDSAGRKAGLALAGKASNFGWSVEILSPPDGLDFNDLARSTRND